MNLFPATQDWLVVSTHSYAIVTVGNGVNHRRSTPWQPVDEQQNTSCISEIGNQLATHKNLPLTEKKTNISQRTRYIAPQFYCLLHEASNSKTHLASSSV